jgi:F-type H+-transporting ATPase subunit gamma
VANLKEVRNRITSVNSTMQITSAMKMVSAAKLRKATDRIIQMRPYANKQNEILSSLSGSLDNSENVFAADSEGKKVLLVLINSNRGLCGGFNANVIKAAKKQIAKSTNGADFKVVTVGKKAFDVFRKSDNLLRDHAISADNHALYDDLNFTTASELPISIMDAYANGDFDKVVLIYNQFKNAATQLVQVEQLLPIETENAEGSKSSSDYIFEPSKKKIVENLIPKSLKTQFYKAVLDSNASEHGARMTAMHKATENAGDMLSALKLSYNKARQAAITTEILEIVGGAAALDDA